MKRFVQRVCSAFGNQTSALISTCFLFLWAVEPSYGQLPIVEFSNGAGASVSELNGLVVLTVKLNTFSSDTVTVEFATIDGTAKAPSDYIADSGTLIFLPFETEKQIWITIVNDSLQETSEDFSVVLSNPINATVGGFSTAWVTITDDDEPPVASIWAETINQDDPKNTTWDSAPPVVFGGSIASTADNLRLTAKATSLSGDTAFNWAWSVTGRGSENYTPPGNLAVWDLGDLMKKPVAGTLMFTCVTTFQSGATTTVNYSVEVGIRSDDAVVVGWINQDGVVLPEADGPWVTDTFPADGNVPGWRVPFALLAFGRFKEFYELPDGLITSFTNKDRRYLLNWMFRFCPNPDPKDNDANDFLTGGIIDYDKVQVFRDKRIGGYKLFNHFQVKFRVAPNGGAYDLFDGPPMVVAGRQETDIGWTPDPITLGWPGPHEGQKGPNDGAVRSTASSVGLINDGSPDVGGINIFNELLGDNRHTFILDFYWENIGSRITFTPTSTKPSSPVITQKYPTYYLYTNGNAPTVEWVQAPQPSAQFISPDFLNNKGGPYPFGNNASSGLGTYYNAFSTPVRAGRNGDATLPPDSTSRIPDFVAP